MAAYAELTSWWDTLRSWFDPRNQHECKSPKYLFLQSKLSTLQTQPCCLRNAMVIVHLSELNAKKAKKAPEDHLDLNQFSPFSPQEVKKIQKHFSKNAPSSVSLPSDLPVSKAHLDLLFETFPSICGIQLSNLHLSEKSVFQVVSSRAIANIDLSSSQLDDQQLSQLVESHPMISGIDISSCFHITDVGMEALSKLRDLRTLRAGGLVQVTAEGLQKIPTMQLEHLDLGDPEGATASSNVDDAVCRHISGARALRYLDLSSAKKGKITGEGILSLASSVSELFLLNLHNSYVGSSEALMSLEQLKNLVYLNLSDDASDKIIDDDVVSMLGTLPKLRILKMSGSIKSKDGEAFKTFQHSPLELFWFDGNHHKINRGIKYLPKGIVELKFSPPEGAPLKEADLEPLLEFDRLKGLSLFDLPGDFAQKFAMRRPPLEILEIGISDSKTLSALIPFGRTLRNLILIYDPEENPHAEALRNFRELEMLTLNTNFSSEDYLTFIPVLKNLRYLSLTDWSMDRSNPTTQPGIDGRVLDAIGKLPYLEMLCLRNAFLRNEDLLGLTQAPSLSHLEIHPDNPENGRIDDNALVYFKAMRSLTYLDVDGQLSESALEQLKR